MQDDASAFLLPEPRETEAFTDAEAAVTRLEQLYGEATAHLSFHFNETLQKGRPAGRVRAFYPEVRLTVTSFSQADTRLSFGHVSAPGTYATTITRPDLFRQYLIQQLGLLIQHHGVPVEVGPSTTPIPVHFAVAGNPNVSVPQEGVLEFSLGDDALSRWLGAPCALHRAAGGLQPGAAVALHGDGPGAFSEPCPVHQLPVLRR
jgi:AMP nucleosidase